MTDSEYEGPVIGALARLGAVVWQYGYLQPDGSVLELVGKPRLVSSRVVRRPLVPTGEWRAAEIENQD